MTKLEELARALCRLRGYDPNILEPGRVFGVDGLKANGDPAHFLWREFVDDARAVVAVLREPSPFMVAKTLPMTGVADDPEISRLAEQALMPLEGRTMPPSAHRDGIAAAKTLIGDWRSMVDAILEEDRQHGRETNED